MAPPHQNAIKTPEELKSSYSEQHLNTIGMNRSLGLNVVSNLAILFLAILSISIWGLSLNPIYGSIPVSATITATNSMVLYVGQIIALLTLHKAALQLSTFERPKLVIPNIQDVNFLRFLAGMVCFISIFFPFVSRYSGQLGPTWGPWLHYYLGSFPILHLPLLRNEDLIVEEIKRKFKLNDPVRGTAVKELQKQVLVLSVILVHMPVTTIFQGIANLSLDAICKLAPMLLGQRGVLKDLVNAIWVSLLYVKTWGALRALFYVHLVISTGSAFPALNTISLNATLQNAGYSLVARQESHTGYISVIDNLKDGFRVMRCDHSLLGGEWINKPADHPAVFNDPIYSIFVILEAVRLVETKSMQDKVEEVDIGKSALVV